MLVVVMGRLTGAPLARLRMAQVQEFRRRAGKSLSVMLDPWSKWVRKRALTLR